MLKPGDVLQFSDPARRVRILWLSVDAISAAVIDIDAPQALPEMMDVKVVWDAIESEQASLLDEATGHFSKPPSPLQPVSRHDVAHDHPAHQALVFLASPAWR